MNKRMIWPFYLLAILALLWIAEPILVPVLIAALLAQLLTPLATRLERWTSSVSAAILSLSVIGMFTSALVGLISTQVVVLQTAMPTIEANLREIATSSTNFLGTSLGLEAKSQIELGNKSIENAIQTGSEAAFFALGTTFSTLATTLLVVILTFLMLYYRRHLHRQLLLLASRRDRQTLGSIFESVSALGQRYVSGLGVVMVIVGILDTIGLFLVKAPFPALFGLAGALAIMIPYIGILIVAPLAATIAWGVTGSLAVAGSVLAVFAVIHTIEGHFVSPTFVGNKVNLNPLTTILAVLIGGELWGAAGMFLFIPLTGIAKILLDKVPDLEPIARLLGPVSPEDIRSMRIAGFIPSRKLKVLMAKKAADDLLRKDPVEASPLIDSRI